MRQLNRPQKDKAKDNINLWDNIVSHKPRDRKSRLKKERPFVLKRYDHYQANMHSLDNITPQVPELDETIANDLRSCYGKNVVFNKARKELYSDVLNADDRHCPYCRLNRIATIDHYFDKGSYPEYSVFLPNLVPCCDECNRTKGSITFNANHERQFVHFYFDSIPSYQFMFVHFSIDAHDNLPKVVIVLKFHAGEQNRQLIESHFGQLGLLKKYEETICEHLSVIREDIRLGKNRGFSIGQIRSLFEIEYNSRLKIYNCNHWEVCMYSGILNSFGFIEQLYNCL